MSRRPFRVLVIGSEHVLVFQPREGEDRMMLVDRVDEALLGPEAEDQVLELHRRRDILNDIYRQWGPQEGVRDDQTLLAIPAVREEEA